MRAAVSRSPVAAPTAAAALVTLTAAVVVIAFGVIATSGVYGSRMAWLLGVALPLLAASMLLSWLAVRTSSRARPNDPAAVPAHGSGVGRVVFASAALLFAIPFALAALLLVFYAVLMVLHGLFSLL
jgi:hypothetical protein